MLLPFPPEPATDGGSPQIVYRYRRRKISSLVSNAFKLRKQRLSAKAYRGSFFLVALDKIEAYAVNRKQYR